MATQRFLEQKKISFLSTLAILVTLLFWGCNSTSPTPIPAPKISYKQNSITVIQGNPITPDSVNFTGQVTSFTVSPTLPVGLKLDSTTGIIYGTPDEVTSGVGYTITATGPGGVDKATVTITVTQRPAPPSISYAQTFVTAIQYVPITPDTLLSTGGPVTTYTVSPSLPPDLILNATTGRITGTPVGAVASAVNYTVTATGPGGSDTAGVTITISEMPGVNWALKTSGETSLYGVISTGLAVGPGTGQLVAVGAAGADGITIHTSPDGVTWTPRAATANLSSVTWTGSSIGSGTGQFVAVGNGIQTSPDGVTWTNRTVGASLSLSSVTWTGSQLVAVGVDTLTKARVILTSPTGQTWTSRTSGVAGNLFSVTWTGSQLVAVGSDANAATILTSPDGVTWTQRILPNEYYSLSSVVWTGTQLVAVGEEGGILTSPNGIAWTDKRFATSDNLLSVTWTGLSFVAVGTNGDYTLPIILTSPDGAIWTKRTSPAGSYFLSAVTWTGSKLIAVGSDAAYTTGIILTSPSP